MLLLHNSLQQSTNYLTYLTCLGATPVSITDQLHVRLTDTALSWDLFPADYYQESVDVTPRPLAWMAIEAITDGVSTQPCDVVRHQTKHT